VFYKIEFAALQASQTLQAAFLFPYKNKFEYFRLKHFAILW
jgi:hypothetical protein